MATSSPWLLYIFPKWVYLFSCTKYSSVNNTKQSPSVIPSIVSEKPDEFLGIQPLCFLRVCFCCIASHLLDRTIKNCTWFGLHASQKQPFLVILGDVLPSYCKQNRISLPPCFWPPANMFIWEKNMFYSQTKWSAVYEEFNKTSFTIPFFDWFDREAMGYIICEIRASR